MIGGFPDLYPDELLYSGMARYADWMVYPTKSGLSRDLFGTDGVQPILDLPNRLDYLVTALPPGHGYPADRLIDRHTLWPFYAPFLPSERANRVRQTMHSDCRANIYAVVGLLPGRIPGFQTLRFCPVCADEDRQRFGETYWHRVPHVPGVEVCPVHQVWLEDTQTPFQGIGDRPLFMSAERIVRPTVPRPLDFAVSTPRILFALARDVAWLLDQTDLAPDRESLRQRYITCLFERDLSTYNGRLYLPRLFEAFQQTYPETLLYQLHCELNLHLDAPWLTNLLRPSVQHASHPLHHLLMTHFLGHTLASFFQLPADRKPFGAGPWPCLNPAADHYRQSCLSTLEVKYRTQDGLPVGRFSCACGFSYTRIGPDRSPDDRFHYGYINKTGPVWDDLFRQLWNDPAVNTKAMRRQLNMDWATLRKHAARLSLPFPPPGFRLTRATSPLPAQPNTVRPRKQRDPAPFREFWLTVVAQYPEAGTTALRRQFPYEYDWLFNYDRDWFDAHRPSPRPHVSVPSRIDWSARDAQWAAAIEATAHRLKTTPGRPFRISRSLLMDSVKASHALHEKANELPLTLQALETYAETYEDFAIRRIAWCTERFRQEGRCPTRYQLANRASVDGKSAPATDSRVQAALQAALQSLQGGAL
ncbi:MAG: hypothetical protein DPW09_41190 [Anaerolineae bacterium]|nr:hypothetical protein [Anaerolineae bacterium]